MREIGPRVKSRFLVLGVVVSLCSALPVCGEDSARENSVPIAVGGAEGFDIHGTVMDAPDFHQALDALEQARPRSGEDLFAAFEKLFGEPMPAANAVVTLSGPSITRETRTDAEGNLSFSRLPAGEYEISAEAPSRPTPNRGVRRTATAKAQITLGPYTGKVSLELSTIRPVIRGRITDPDGKPIRGAKVTAALDVHHVVYDGWLENHDAPTWSAVTSADGAYELNGMEPANTYHLMGVLAGGKAPREFVDIHVEADGYVQAEENIPEIPLVTEDVVILARRFLNIYNQWAQRMETDEHPEKEGLPFPASQGNTITGIDIVLEPVGANAGEDAGKGSGAEGGTAVSPGFVEIRIESHPQGWGYAHKTVQPDGSIMGAHQSGGPDAVRVYETKSEVTAEDMAELNNLVSALRGRSLPVVARPDQKSQGYRSVIIVTGQDTAITVYAQGEEEFAPQEIQRIWDLVIKYRVGAW